MLEDIISGDPNNRSRIDDVLDVASERRPKNPEYQYHIAFCENEHLLPESFGYLIMDITKHRLYDVTYPSNNGSQVSF